MNERMLLCQLVICLLCSPVALQAADVSGCDIVIRKEGSVTSVNYPNPYPTDVRTCTIKVIAPHIHQVVSLTVVHLDTRSTSKNECNKKSDNVLIYDGDNSRWKSWFLKLWCGKKLPAETTIVTSRHIATILFRTHEKAHNHRTGFKINIKFVGDCGRSPYPDAASLPLPKIIGGIPARPFEFPWMAILRYLDIEEPNRMCAGTIINNNWILSAAHCVEKLYDDVEIRVHVHNRSDENADFQSFLLTYYTAPRGYGDDEFSLDYDILLIKVGDIKFSEEVQPICMPNPGDLYVGRTVSASGWGTRGSAGSVADELHYTTMKAISNEVCAPLFPFYLVVTERMVCAADSVPHPTRDTCYGDSGGPLSVQEADGRFHIIGVTAWGYGCAYLPGVYTRVTSFLEWIHEIIMTK